MRIDHGLHAGVARVAHNLENLTHAARWRRAHEAHPRNVVVHGVRSVLLSPYIEQNQIALANRHRMARMRLVVRITGVGIDGNDRRIVGQKILAGEGFHEPLLDFVFFRAAIADALADFFERCGDNGIDAVAGGEVRM